MADPKEPSWERITDGDTEQTFRLEVPGGHLYKTVQYEEHTEEDHDFTWYEAKAVAMCFVPDSPSEVLRKIAASGEYAKMIRETMKAVGAEKKDCVVCGGSGQHDGKPCPVCSEGE